jgi:hypothetical protein
MGSSTFRVVLALALAVPAVVGCEDAGTDPLADVMTSETEPAIALRDALPSMPDWAMDAGLDLALGAEVGIWLDSWEMDPDDGRERRLPLYQRVAPSFAEAMGPRGAEELLGEVSQALLSVEAIDDEALPGEMHDEIERARELVGEGLRAVLSSETEAAFMLGWQASDALKELTPGTVASAVVARAERELGGADSSVSDVDLDRGQRLLEGAVRALEVEDWELAIRRGFYAWQVLGGNPPR